jgi:hypothetical protein
MNKIYLHNQDELLGTTSSYVYEPAQGGHRIAAIALLRLEHGAAMRLAEGSSLPELFKNAHLSASGRTTFASVLSGTYELHTKSRPTLKDVILFLHREKASSWPQLGEVLSRGARLLNTTR